MGCFIELIQAYLWMGLRIYESLHSWNPGPHGSPTSLVGLISSRSSSHETFLP
jgi:hypothetical protein